MSAYTTLHVTRSKAIKLYFEHKLSNVTDKMLEEFLDDRLHNALYNTVVVSDDFKQNDNATVDFYIE